MGRAAPLTELERKRIEAALRAGASQHAAAQRFGRGKTTVHRVAAAAGIAPQPTERSRAATNAAAVHRDYARANRLDLLNAAFERAGAMLAPGGAVATPQELQQLATAIAILIDKRRLEDGEATARSEVHDFGAARERVLGRLADLAARRRAGGGAAGLAG